MNIEQTEHLAATQKNVCARKYRLKEKIQLIKSRLPIHIRLSGIGDGDGDANATITLIG